MAPATAKATHSAPKPWTTAKPVPIHQAVLPAPAKIKNVVEKRKLVTMSHCGAARGGWSANGTARNPGSDPAHYTITVFFTTNKATVQDYAVTKLTVAAGKTTNWTASKKFPATKPTLCVLRVVG